MGLLQWLGFRKVKADEEQIVISANRLDTGLGKFVNDYFVHERDMRTHIADARALLTCLSQKGRAGEVRIQLIGAKICANQMRVDISQLLVVVCEKKLAVETYISQFKGNLNRLVTAFQKILKESDNPALWLRKMEAETNTFLNTRKFFFERAFIS